MDPKDKIIAPKDVEYIAHLARIQLESEEVSQLTKNLGDILHYITKLSSLDISKVEPTSHVLPLKNVYRDDIVKPSLPQKEALAIAPEQHNGFFKVPKVIE